jgi:hypothetical protein
MKTIRHIRRNCIEIDPNDVRVRLVGYPDCDNIKGRLLGDGIAILWGDKHETFLLNTVTCIMRQFVDKEERLLVEDTEVNDRQISSHLSNGHNYLRNRIACFGGLHTWDGFKDGFCALDWTIYPDGRYFADEGGFGMESNDEEVAYCVINKNLDVVVPFFYAEDPKDVLHAVRAGTYKQEYIEPINSQEVIVDVFPIPTIWDKIATMFRMIYYSIKEKFTRKN